MLLVSRKSEPAPKTKKTAAFWADESLTILGTGNSSDMRQISHLSVCDHAHHPWVAFRRLLVSQVWATTVTRAAKIYDLAAVVQAIC